jgi:hypothetical protein
MYIAYRLNTTKDKGQILFIFYKQREPSVDFMVTRIDAVSPDFLEKFGTGKYYIDVNTFQIVLDTTYVEPIK